MLVSDLDYSDYVGRLAVGRVVHGSVHEKDNLVCVGEEGRIVPLKVSKLQVYDGIKFGQVESASSGDIVVLAGIEDVHIGDTICTREAPKALKRITVDEPTISMRFSANNSPLSGQEGQVVQARKIRERLFKETLRNVAIQVEDGEDTDHFIVKGRGEFQMAILIETMRREGFEMSVSRPKVIFREKEGKTLEPIEHMFIDCDETFTGIVTEKLSRRKARMVNLVNHGTGRVRLEFTVPSRGLIGYRSEFLTDTRGTGIMNSYLQGYEAYRGDFPGRVSGSLVADRQGVAMPFSLFNLEPRGRMFVMPGDMLYEGMIVGEHNRDNDLNVNPTKKKHQHSIRAANKEENVLLTPVTPMTLERAIEFIKDDELVEVTPKNVRLRKVILAENMR